MDVVFFQQLLNGVVQGSIYCLMALGLTMIFGILEIANFAHGEVYMIGAFVTFFLTMQAGVPYLLSIPVAFIVTALLGVVMEKIVFRPILGKPMINGMLVSFGLSTFLMNLALYFFKADPRKIDSGYGHIGFNMGGVLITLERAIVIAVAFALVLMLVFFIKRSKIGRAMRAVAQDRDAAHLAGVNVQRIFVITFALGCGLASAAGSLVGAIFTVYPSMGWTPVLKSFVVVILGGFGNVTGAITAGMALGLVESLCGGYISFAFKDAYAFVLLMAAFLLKPEGLVGGKK